jgi:anaerobic selenocysteine-containing dehydrogenase
MVERRTFLKGSALAAGSALLQACGEDAQYLVQPLERPEGRPGEGVWKTSVCGQCAAGCGTTVRVVDGDARKLEGLRTHPINHGGLCALGQAGLQAHYDPDRITAPMVRRPVAQGVNAKVSAARRSERPDPLEAVEWDAALKVAAEAIAAAAASDPRSVVFVDGSGNSFLHALLARLARAIGAPAPLALEPPQLEVEREAARIALGFSQPAAYDLPRSDYILSIGPAFLDRGPQPAWSTWAMGRLRGGTPGRRGKLVHSEARMSLTAAYADEWLPVLPGQEGTLARAIAGILLAEAPGRGDAAAYQALFPEAPPSLEESARRCDLPAKTIRRVARELASAERPVVLGGGSAALFTNGLASTTAALALNLLLGSVGRPGGVHISASFGVAKRLLPADAPGAMSTTALEAKLRGIGDPPRVLIVCECDPAHTRPAARGWREGLGNVETIIALTSAFDDTASVADVVLPVHSDIERFQAVEPAGLAFPVLSVAKPTVKPIGDGRHPGDIVLALATALGHGADLPWESFEAMAEQTVTASAASLPGGAASDAAAIWTDALERGGIWQEAIAAPAGAASVASAAATTPRTPVLSAPIVAEAPVEASSAGADAGAPAPAGEAGAGPAGESSERLTLLLFESPKYGDGRGANKSWLQELPDTLTTVMWNGWAEIASRDAQRLGIATGDRVELTTDSGSIEVAAVVRPEARPGTIALPLGTGHLDYGRYARDRGANPLDLVGTDNVEGTTAPALSGSRVEVRRTGVAKLALYGRGLRQAEHIPTGWAPMEKPHS